MFDEILMSTRVNLSKHFMKWFVSKMKNQHSSTFHLILNEKCWTYSCHSYKKNVSKFLLIRFIVLNLMIFPVVTIVIDYLHLNFFRDRHTTALIYVQSTSTQRTCVSCCHLVMVARKMSTKLSPIKKLSWLR